MSSVVHYRIVPLSQTCPSLCRHASIVALQVWYGWLYGSMGYVGGSVSAVMLLWLCCRHSQVTMLATELGMLASLLPPLKS